MIGDPCFNCAVRADLGCPHQAAYGEVPPAIRIKEKAWSDGRAQRSQGYNFGGTKAEVLRANIRRLRQMIR